MHSEKTWVIYCLDYALLKDNNLQIKMNFFKEVSESV